MRKDKKRRKETYRIHIDFDLRDLLTAQLCKCSTKLTFSSKKAGNFKEAQTASIEETNDPLKLLENNIGERKSHSTVKKIFNSDDYVDVDFSISVTKSSTLTNKEI